MEPDGIRWEKTRRAFFPRSAAPSAAQTEAFVSRVMARLPALETDERPFWSVHRWFVPALGLSFAALAFSFLPAGGEPEDAAAVLLLADAGGTSTVEFLSASETDAAQAFLLEER